MVFALLMILLSTAVWAAPAQSGRPQKLASAGTVPEGLRSMSSQTRRPDKRASRGGRTRRGHN